MRSLNIELLGELCVIENAENSRPPLNASLARLAFISSRFLTASQLLGFLFPHSLEEIEAPTIIHQPSVSQLVRQLRYEI